MKNHTWIRNLALCASFSTFDMADKARNDLRYMRKGQPDERKRKVRVRKRANGTFDVIVWERPAQETEAKKPKRARNKRKVEG